MEYKDYNDNELISYIAEGNEDANNLLIEKYKPLITKVATKMLPYCESNGYDLNDLIQEGMIGLNHAIDRYHEQKDVLFYTYAKLCIERKIISVVIGSNRGKNKVLNESISYDDEETNLLSILKDSTPSPEEVMIDLELEKDLNDKIKGELTDFENQVFQLLVSGFLTQEIADMLDKDKKSIENAIQRIRIKIKKVLNK